jgi:hypothetical protein
MQCLSPVLYSIFEYCYLQPIVFFHLEDIAPFRSDNKYRRFILRINPEARLINCFPDQKEVSLNQEGKKTCKILD